MSEQTIISQIVRDHCKEQNKISGIVYYETVSVIVFLIGPALFCYYFFSEDNTISIGWLAFVMTLFVLGSTLLAIVAPPHLNPQSIQFYEVPGEVLEKIANADIPIWAKSTLAQALKKSKQGTVTFSFLAEIENRIIYASKATKTKSSSGFQKMQQYLND